MLKILLIDTDMPQLVMLQRTLTMLGYIVASSASASSARSLIKSFRPDLVVINEKVASDCTIADKPIFTYSDTRAAVLGEQVQGFINGNIQTANI